MEEKFYILASVINYSDETSTGFSLYRKLEYAEKAMAQEIAEISENFDMDSMELTTDLPRYKEYLDQNGVQGFIVNIEEVVPL